MAFVVISIHMKKLNLIGLTFHRLTVMAEAPDINHRSAWVCQCECGTIKNIKTEELRSGGTKSCGCWNVEQRAKRVKNMYSKCIKYSPEIASARKIWKTRYPEINFDDFYHISQQNCYYCNSAPANSQNVATKKSSQEMKDKGHFIYNGLDRLDNNKQHSKDNCVACCKYCNYAKRERTEQEFKDWIIKVYHFYLQPK